MEMRFQRDLQTKMTLGSRGVKMVSEFVRACVESTEEGYQDREFAVMAITK